MSNKRRKRYGIAILVLLVFFLSIWTFYPSDKLHNGHAQAMGGFQAITDSDDKGGYNEYLKSYSAEDRPSQVIRIEGESFADSDGEGFEVADHPEGLDGKAVITPDAGSISWNVPVGQAGLYNLRIHYYPIEGKSSAIERTLTINDEQPFTGAENLLFDRLWGNRDAQIQRDDRGNDLRPRQIEKPAWQLEPFYG